MNKALILQINDTKPIVIQVSPEKLTTVYDIETNEIIDE